MISNKCNELLRFLKKMTLYFKVGMARMTPVLAKQMLKYVFLTKILKREIPWLIELSVTYECQAKCPHCSVHNYIASEKEEDKLLTNDEIKQVLDQAVKIGIPKVDLFGGEPLLKEGIADLVAHGAKLGLYMSVTTNGWSLSRDMIKNLVKAGISCVNISIDSAEGRIHDRLRGLEGLFGKVTEGIKMCREEGVACIASTYVTKKGIVNLGKGKEDNSSLTKIINLTRGLGATGIRILFPIISGRWEQSGNKEFTENEKAFVIDNIDPSFAFIEGAYSVKKGKKVCQSLRGKMFNISPEGNIQICVAFPDTFGNIRQTPLAELIHYMWGHPTYLKNKGGNCCNNLGLIRENDGKKKTDVPQGVC